MCHVNKECLFGLLPTGANASFQIRNKAYEHLTESVFLSTSTDPTAALCPGDPREHLGARPNGRPLSPEGTDLEPCECRIGVSADVHPERFEPGDRSAGMIEDDYFQTFACY